tara:strand:+ start:60 stop:587 length:528 start_codon:yes stop_codon:yes gene_type:complete
MSDELTKFETLLGNVVMPSLVNPQVTNRQLIDAAILRGSLELLKPRQPGENFASQASRALKAGTDFGKDVFDQQQSALETLLKQQKLAQGKTPSQVTMTEEKALGFESATRSLYDISPEVKAAVDLLGGLGFSSDPGVAALSAEAMSIQSADPTLSATDAIKKAAEKIDKYTDIE